MRMTRKACALAVSLAFAASPARAFMVEKGKASLEVNGSARYYEVIELHEPRDQSSSFRLNLESSARYGSNLKLFTSADLFLDGLVIDNGRGTLFKNFEDIYQRRQFSIDLNEAYLDYYGSNFDLRIGLQKINWGKLDEINPTDLLNTEDLTDFAMEFKVDRKNPVPAVKLDYYPGLDTSIEVVFVPWFVPYRMPLPGERWFFNLQSTSDAFVFPGAENVDLGPFPMSFFNPLPPPLVLMFPVSINDLDILGAEAPLITRFPELRNPAGVENFEAALRLSHNFGRFDVSVMGFYGFDPRPTYRFEGQLFTSIPASAFSNDSSDDTISLFPPSITINNPELDLDGANAGVIDLIPSLHKIYAFGADMSASLGSYTVRAEAAYYGKRYFNVDVSELGPESILIGGLPAAQAADLLTESVGAGFGGGPFVIGGPLAPSLPSFAIPIEAEIEFEHASVSWGFGIERIFSDWSVLLQFVQDNILNVERQLIFEPRENSLTVSINRTWMNETLEFDIGGSYNFSRKSHALASRVTYSVRDNLDIEARVLFLGGAASTPVGSFETRDQVILGVEYFF